MYVAMPFNIQGLGYVEAFRKATANFNEEVHAPTCACEATRGLCKMLYPVPEKSLHFGNRVITSFLHKPSGQKLMRMIT